MLGCGGILGSDKNRRLSRLALEAVETSTSYSVRLEILVLEVCFTIVAERVALAAFMAVGAAFIIALALMYSGIPILLHSSLTPETSVVIEMAPRQLTNKHPKRTPEDSDRGKCS